jgi:hypothetical protein
VLIPIEIVLKGQDRAVTESILVPHDDPSTWDELVVREILVEVLRAIDRAQNPSAARDRAVALRGFSWIVEPVGDKVILAIEIPMGAAVAGPLAISQARLDAIVTSVLRVEQQLFSKPTIH